MLGDVRSGNINTWSTKKDESEPTPNDSATGGVDVALRSGAKSRPVKASISRRWLRLYTNIAGLWEHEHEHERKSSTIKHLSLFKRPIPPNSPPKRRAILIALDANYRSMS